MQEQIPNLPPKDESLARCEVGVDCLERGECFLAHIRASLTETAINASVMDQITPDNTIVEKAAALHDIENALAKCGISLTTADIQPEGA